jgi:hypothetical protein
MTNQFDETQQVAAQFENTSNAAMKSQTAPRPPSPKASVTVEMQKTLRTTKV